MNWLLLLLFNSITLTVVHVFHAVTLLCGPSFYYYYYKICIAHKFKHARVGGIVSYPMEFCFYWASSMDQFAVNRVCH